MYHRGNKDEYNETDQGCRFCGEADLETSFHVMAECEKFADQRWNIFQQNPLSDPPDWSISQVTRFLKETPIGDVLDQHG